MNEVLQIGGRFVGTGAPCFLVAEVGQAHDGSLGTAHAYVDAAADAGADAVKFQTHIAHAESTPGEPWRVRFSRQDETRFDYWKRMEFEPAQWRELAQHARERNLEFLSTPFSLDAIELLEQLELPAWKVGSGEIGNAVFLRRMAATGKPVILSSGMSSWSELDGAVELVRSNGAACAVLQCTTEYPCPPEKVGLNVLDELRKRYGVPVGLSDHSGQPFAGLAAAALGANLLEMHIVFSKRCFGPDTPASLTIDQFSELARGVRFIERALKNPVDKEAEARRLSELKRIFGRSIVAARALHAGQVLQPSDIALKKPAGGLGANDFDRIVGKRLRRELQVNDIIREGDVEL
ncbi:MAG TPA: N-acetylneuraminate synthase family protein [Polyangiaceae bacterium]|nr:N-acetylneuraminate synthase family protein [Polyangiaceae bacterium]